MYCGGSEFKYSGTVAKIPPTPTGTGGAYGYIMRAFAKAPQATSTEAMTESCSRIAWQSTQYSFRISGNRGYVSNRVHSPVHSLSILHFVLRRKTLGEPV